MFGLGSSEIIILAVVIVLFFGSKKVPELVRSIGEGIKIIRNGFSDEDEKDKDKKM